MKSFCDNPNCELHPLVVGDDVSWIERRKAVPADCRAREWEPTPNPASLRSVVTRRHTYAAGGGRAVLDLCDDCLATVRAEQQGPQL